MDLDTFLAAARELVTIRSTADRPDELRRALDFVLGFVGAGFTVERFESNGKPSALVYLGDRRPVFRVLLNAHLDVVPGADALFAPRLVGGRLFGRGAQDMKVSALVLASVFRELAAVLPHPVGLQLVTDEEVGGRDGTLHQLERGVSARFVVIGEHSGLRLVVESKGLLTVRVDAVGRGGHGAYPWLGDNAVVRVWRAVERLLAVYPVPVGESWATTVNVAWVETSNRAVNQIPADATAWLDVRFPPGDADLAGRSAVEVAQFVNGICGSEVVVSVERLSAPHWTDPDGAVVVALRRAVEEVGWSPELLRKHGAADSRFYHERGIDTVVFGIRGDGQHGPDEYADVGSVVPYYRALSRFLLTLPD